MQMEKDGSFQKMKGEKVISDTNSKDVSKWLAKWNEAQEETKVVG